MTQMPMSSPKIVAVRPAAALAERPRLFAALEAALPVSFRGWRDGAAPDALLAFDDGPMPERLPAIAIAVAARAGDGERVQIGEEAAVDRRVHGVELERQAVAAPLVPAADEAVLATAAGGPVWTRSVATGVQRVGCALPELDPDQILRDGLGSPRGVALIALVQFLRELTAESRGTVPPLRAALLFDDPNLRWRSYGFIDYAGLLAHADAHGYHASMAMIPLDVGAGAPRRRAAVPLPTRPAVARLPRQQPLPQASCSPPATTRPRWPSPPRRCGGSSASSGATRSAWTAS